MSNVCRTALLLAIGACLLLGGCGQTSKPTSAIEKRLPGSQQSVDSASDKASRESAGVHRVSGSPVSAILTIEPPRSKPGERVTLTVKLEIEPLWEVRELSEQMAPTATRLDLKLPDALEAVNGWEAPRAIRSALPDGHSVYVDEAKFIWQLHMKPDAIAGEIPIKCRLHFQACNDRQCVEPTAVELATVLKVE